MFIGLTGGGIYDGTSSNVGYYGLLLAVYRLFGFSVFTAKLVRAVLALGTLLGLTLIARKLVPGKYGLAVLALNYRNYVDCVSTCLGDLYLIVRTVSADYAPITNLSA